MPANNVQCTCRRLGVIATLSLNGCKSSTRRGWAYFPPRFLVAKGNKDVSRWRVSEYLKRKFDGRVNYPGRRFSCYQGKHGRDDYFALSRTARYLAARCYGCEPGYGL